jgi:hypothetical protein
MLYKTLTRPILIYGSECWLLSKNGGNLLRTFERRILKPIYGSVNDNGLWRTRCNSELYTLYDEPDVAEVVKIGRSRWLGQLFRMQELNSCRKLTLLKPEDTRRAGKPELRWLESAEEILKNMGVRNWRCRSRDRKEWRTILEEAKVLQGM